MTFDADSLLSTLAENRPTETELTHHITTGKIFHGGKDHGLWAICSCDQFYVETAGTDESSRSAVTAAVRAHEEKP